MKMKNLYFNHGKAGLLALLLLNGFLFNSCIPFHDLLGNVPEVSLISPRGILQPGDAIRIQFSEKMDRSSVLNALQFRRSDQLLDIAPFEWEDDSSLILHPRTIEKPYNYSLTITSLARANTGLPMKASFTHQFLTISDTQAPRLLGIHPDLDSLVEITGNLHLVFSFSEAIERTSFYQSFALSPDLPGSFSWAEEDREITFISESVPSRSTDYLLQLGSGCRDLEGVALTESRQWAFTVHPTELPKVESIILHSDSYERRMTAEASAEYSINSRDAVELLFEGSVDLDRQASIFSLQPDPGYLVEWNADGSSARISFQDPLIWQEEYRLQVADESYFLRCDGSLSGPIGLEAVAFCKDTSGSSPIFEVIAPNQLLEIEPSPSACLELYLSHASDTEIPDTQLMEHIDVYCSNGSAFLSPLSLQAVDIPGYGGFTAGPGKSVVQYRFSLEPQDTAGRMILTISAALKDSAGNTPEEEIRVSYNL